MILASSEERISHQSVEAAGIRLHALAAGAGGPPVVLFHGASGNAHDFTFGTIQALARDHRVLAFDRPGLGASEPLAGAENPIVQARAISAALHRLGLARPILVGHSYGGAVALAWALAEPASLRGLVLLGAPSHLWQGRTGLTNGLLATPLLGHAVAAAAPPVVSRAFMEGAAARVFAPQAPPAGYLDRLGPDRLLQPATLHRNARQLTALRDHIRAMVPRYPSLPMPIELIHGEVDTIVPPAIHAELFADRVRSARLTILPGIGHMPHHAAPDVLQAAIGRLACR